MSKLFKRCAVIFTIILTVQVFGSSFTSAYAQLQSAETQNITIENKKTAYITLDDGPSRYLTTKNLDTLKKYGVKATFFVLPKNDVDDLYKRIVEEGHAIGNHSYSHDYNYLYSSTENFKKDVIKAENFIFEKIGYTTTVFRFPGGAMGRSQAVVKARANILADLGYNYFDWNVSTGDTDPNLKSHGSEEYIVSLLVNNILNNTRDRKELIILMHDTSIYSAKALPRIIEGLQKQGYVFDVLTNDGDWQYELNENGEVVITGYIGYNKVVSVPCMLDGRPVTSISSDVFTDDPITSINIPDSVVNIDSGAFWECRTLEAINFSEGNPNYKSVDGVVFDITGTLLKQYPPGKNGSYTVAEGVNIIGEGAFRGANGLKQVILSDSVSQIDTAAFAYCEGLMDVQLGNGLISVGGKAFQCCFSLHAIVVPQSVEVVENMAFESCESLTDIYFLGDLPDFGENAFQNTSEEFSVNYIESNLESWIDYSDYPQKPFLDIPFFHDIASGAWYNQAVNFIAARGITTGTGNGNFSPDGKLTRGQVITFLMRVYGIEPDANPIDNFGDAGSTYYTGYIAAAKRLGISSGMDDKLLAPEKESTRQEMFTILYNLLTVTDQLPQDDSGKTLTDFSDAEQIEFWALDAMSMLVETGIISGSGGKLTPLSTTTRAEMAQMLYNMLSK